MSQLKIHINNVGHGQSVHALTPNGKILVIDLGCSKDFSPLYLLRQETDTIDSLTITHPHGDHIDEIELIKTLGFKVRQLWRPSWMDKSEVYAQNQSSYGGKLDAYYAISDAYTHPIPSESLIGNPDSTGGVSIKRHSTRDCGMSNINNHSIVTVFEYLGVSVVIPGDNEPPSWRKLMENSDFASTMANQPVFMASHHGRLSGFLSDIFVSNPRLCIVSDGRAIDTDGRHKYTEQAGGWTVHNRSGRGSGKRLCLTTRSDGWIEIIIGKDPSGQTFLQVTSD